MDEHSKQEHFKKTQTLLEELHNLGISIAVLETQDNPNTFIDNQQNRINEKIIKLGQHLNIENQRDNTPNTEIFKNKSADSLLNKIYMEINARYGNEKLFEIKGSDGSTLIIPTWYRSSHPNYKNLQKNGIEYPDNFRINIDKSGNVSVSLACTANKRQNTQVNKEYKNAINWRYSDDVQQKVQEVQQTKNYLNPSNDKPSTIIVNNLMTNTGGLWGLRGRLLQVASLSIYDEPVKQDKRTKTMKSGIEIFNNDEDNNAGIKIIHCQTQVSGASGANHLGLSDHKLDLTKIIQKLDNEIKTANVDNELQKTLTNMMAQLKEIHNKPTTLKSSAARLIPLIAATAFFLTNPVGLGALGLGIACAVVGISGSILGKRLVGHSSKDRFLISGYIDAISSKLPNVECWSSCKSGQDRTAAHEIIAEAISKTDFSQTIDIKERVKCNINDVYKNKKTTGSLSKAACYVKIRLPRFLKAILNKKQEKAINDNESIGKFAENISTSPLYNATTIRIRISNRNKNAAVKKAEVELRQSSSLSNLDKPLIKMTNDV